MGRFTRSRRSQPHVPPLPGLGGGRWRVVAPERGVPKHSDPDFKRTQGREKDLNAPAVSACGPDRSEKGERWVKKEEKERDRSFRNRAHNH